MIGKYSNKAAKGHAIKCVRDCDAPGIGAFKAGDLVADPEIVEKLKDNPNFKAADKSVREEK